MKEFKEEHIELFKEQLQKILGAGSIAAWTLCLDSYTIFGERALFDFFGLEYPITGELPLPFFINSIHPSCKEQVLVAINLTVKNRVPYEIEYKLIFDGEHERWVKAYGRVNDLENPTKLLGFITDITEKKHLEKQSNSIGAALNKNNFQSIASHELKMPLTTLKASIQLLDRMVRADASVEKTSELLSSAERNVDKLDTLIPGLLNLPNFSDKGIKLNRKPTTLKSIADGCLKHTRFMATHNIVIKEQTSAGSAINADVNRLEQVIINFIDNAIKYAPYSTEIIIEIGEADGEVTLSVTDFGEGIEADKMPFLFNRYYRINPPELHYSGLGLGLYISKEIIEAHQGRIGLISEAGKGSTFWFSIPVMSVAQPVK